MPPGGYTYVGPCRCGFGPHAYYQTAQGQIVPAAALFAPPVAPPAPAPGAAELEQLRAEKADLERRLRELDERLRSEG